MNIRKSAALPFVLILGVFIACAGAPKGNNSGADSPPPSVPGAPATPGAPGAPTTAGPEITLTEFDQIKNGMTYEQVKDIVGVAGEVQSEFTASDPKYASKTYTFKGANLAQASVIFTGGVVSSKMQFGLQP